MEERLRILEMVREGKITAEEADRLLDALARERPAVAPAPRGRLMRVQITGHRGGNANFTLPLTLVDVIAPLLPKRLRVEDKEIDAVRLLTEIRESGVQGKVLDVRDHRGTHIEITIE